MRSHRTRAASSRRWRSAAGRWRPSSSATRAASRASGSRWSRCSAPRRFIRSSGSSERVETYHDRIREVLAAQIAPAAVRRIHGLHGAGARRAAKRRLRGAVRALSRRRRRRERVDSGRSCRREGRRRARLRSGRVLLPARAGADAGLIRRPRWREGLANALANAGRPAEAADAYLRAAAGSRSCASESSSSGAGPSSS